MIVDVDGGSVHPPFCVSWGQESRQITSEIINRWGIVADENNSNRKKADQKRVERESTRPGVWDEGTPMVVSHSLTLLSCSFRTWNFPVAAP